MKVKFIIPIIYGSEYIRMEKDDILEDGSLFPHELDFSDDKNMFRTSLTSVTFQVFKKCYIIKCKQIMYKRNDESYEFDMKILEALGFKLIQG